jgi:3alpha(or 20beta)-hydroxysteroid dehydrogenase
MVNVGLAGTTGRERHEETEMARLDGKVALITGGARGMGAVEARLFAEEGARVALADVKDELGSALAHELGDAAAYIHLDVTSEADWVAAAAAVVERFGRLDVLVNNAGVIRMGAIAEMTLADYQFVIDVNQTGTFLGMKTAIPLMLQAGGGSIVNIASAEGMQGTPGGGAYCASKHAVIGLTKTAAIEMAQAGIRVNAVCPGGVSTPLIEELSAAMGGAPVLDMITAHSPLKRGARPEEIAELVLWLASDASSYVTGAPVPIDGGMLAGITLE